MPHLPAAGEIVLFDRSWYNRAGVERGDGLLQPEADGQAFLKQAPVFEKLLVDDGILLLQVLADGRPGAAGSSASPSAWPTRSSAGSSRRSTCRRATKYADYGRARDAHARGHAQVLGLVSQLPELSASNT
ncbi:MAG: hypothetical protein MZW92_41220 [Comamonadaceae bacterium]|nr:hypothetical protein [Comamonadaceae bacterium]